MNIKSHHNVGGLPEHVASEAAGAAARAVQGRGARAGLALGLAARYGVPPSVPGPGLGVRILGEVKREYADLLRRADAIFIDELRAAGCVRTDRAGIRRVPSGAFRGRDGRRPHLRIRGRAARGADGGLHDCAMGRAAPRAAVEGFEPHHQRSARHQPRGIRHSSKPPATIEWE